MNNIDKKIQEIVSQDLKMPSKYTDTINKTFEILESPTHFRHTKLKLTFATICCSLFLVTGIVFAKDIGNFLKGQFENFGLGIGVDTAIENGYIGTAKTNSISQNAIISTDNSSKMYNTTVTESNQNLSFETININTKIGNFIMTNTDLSIEFYLEFDNEINNYVNLGKELNGNIDYEGSHNIELTDLFILDEENRLIYANPNITKEAFNKFSKEHNLSYEYEDLSFSNYYGKSYIREYNLSTNTIETTLIHSMTYNEYPNSKKLNIFFTEITLIPKVGIEENNNKLTLKGDWKFQLEVPEKMYNRSNEYYEVISCDNQKFKVFETQITDTEFRIGVTISDIEKFPTPAYPTEFSSRLQEVSKEKGVNGTTITVPNTREELIEFLGDEKYVIMYENFMKGWEESQVIIEDNQYKLPWEKDNKDYCYLITSNNERFELNANQSGGEFIDENNYNYYGVFELTKYNCTDQITVILNFRGTPVKIKLKKILSE